MSGRIKQINSALPELLIGIVMFGILFEAAGICFVKDKIGYGIGVLIGTVIAAAMAIHMAKTLDTALDMDGVSAEKKIRLGSVFRYLIVVMLICIVGVTEFANPLAVFLGVMCLKVSAYTQPFIHKVSTKIIKKEE